MRNNATKRIFARIDAMNARGAGLLVYIPPVQKEESK